MTDTEISVEVTDATKTLYDLASDELGTEVVEEQVRSAVAGAVTQVYNNRNEISEQLEEA